MDIGNHRDIETLTPNIELALTAMNWVYVEVGIVCEVAIHNIKHLTKVVSCKIFFQREGSTKF